ncbi:MAG: hypothetical protein LBF62_08425 [Tannerellaceae bacterium]|jgi:hypothetical protein|nr:hypothetical protein [Tannerellaceae bacterium]
MKNDNFNLNKFEQLQTSTDTLKGGFSTAFGSEETFGNGLPPINALGDCSTKNSNCSGGNCVAGCGS